MILIRCYPKGERIGSSILKSDCSPVANQLSKPITITQEGMAAADDLDIEAYACVQYNHTYTYDLKLNWRIPFRFPIWPETFSDNGNGCREKLEPLSLFIT